MGEDARRPRSHVRWLHAPRAAITTPPTGGPNVASVAAPAVHSECDAKRSAGEATEGAVRRCWLLPRFVARAGGSSHEWLAKKRIRRRQWKFERNRTIV